MTSTFFVTLAFRVFSISRRRAFVSSCCHLTVNTFLHVSLCSTPSYQKHISRVSSQLCLPSTRSLRPRQQENSRVTAFTVTQLVESWMRCRNAEAEDNLTGATIDSPGNNRPHCVVKFLRSWLPLELQCPRSCLDQRVGCAAPEEGRVR